MLQFDIARKITRPAWLCNDCAEMQLDYEMFPLQFPYILSTN